MFVCKNNKLIIVYNQFRTCFFDIHRKTYQHRNGLRSNKDILDEEREIKEGKHILQQPESYSILGNKKITSKEKIFYTDREGGKGYSDFANTSYRHRPYVWGPLRFMFKLTNVVMIVFLIIAFVDFDW